MGLDTLVVCVRSFFLSSVLDEAIPNNKSRFARAFEDSSTVRKRVLIAHRGQQQARPASRASCDLLAPIILWRRVKRGGIGRVPLVRHGDTLLCGQYRHKGAGLRMTVRIEGGELTPRG